MSSNSSDHCGLPLVAKAELAMTPGVRVAWFCGRSNINA